MAIPSGTKFGSYEVLAQIGAGGMGEVYQAHDTKLGRDVAIKVLPANFVDDPERLARFQREARMLAALNHQNIATIYGLEQSGNVACLVMELVPGETLAERVRAGPLAIEEALKISAQIAEALEAAHEKGIIHRDLKPANVKVTPEGKVKVLDFGLAKAFEGDSAAEDMGNSPTLSRAATMQGVILGTAAYMSPEQARGKLVDKRTDIWAFGCVLYELLSGKQAFQGETVTDIIAKILQTEPDWKALPSATPSQIHTLLRRCLQKDKNLRLRDAGDARIEIQEALTAPATAEQTPGPIAQIPVWRRLMPWGIGFAVGLILASLATWFLKTAPAPPPRLVTRFTISLPQGQSLIGGVDSAIAISPDGARLAYVASQSGSPQQLYLRAMNDPDAKPISGTEGATSPFFSPDGQWLGFFAAGKLKKISITGGAALTLCDASTGYADHASWGANDTIVFRSGDLREVVQVSAAGGAAKSTAARDTKSQNSDLWPEFLPGANAVLSAAGVAGTTNLASTSHVVVHSLETGERRELVGGSSPTYAPTGHLIYAQAGTLTAVPFDLRRLATTGSPVPVLENVAESTVTGITQYSFSSNGTMVYLSGGLQEVQRKLVWVDRKGAEQTLTAPARAYRTPRISPDGRQVAVGGVDADIWLYDVTRDSLSRLTFHSGAVPAWSPDGKRIAFASNGGKGNRNIYWQPADGSGSAEPLTTFPENAHNTGSWSPDGQVLAFEEVNPSTGYDIWTLTLSDRKTQAFLHSQFNESAPEFSPDGHWLAYVSDESGRREIYVQAYPGPGGKWQISTDGGTEPRWGRDGEIFYRSGEKMMAVRTTLKPGFSADKPAMLFEGHYEPTLATKANYDVTPDGQRFLMVKANEQNISATQINVVLNWFEELKQKVPTGKN
jgi:serine/threonine protein kinase